MSKGLEALERVHKFDSDLHIIYKELRDNSEDYKTIEKELKEGQNFKDEFYKLIGTYSKDIIAQNEEIASLQKKLKALEIIKEKKADICWFINPKDLWKYNKEHLYELTQEEYDLLKEELQ